MTMAQIVCPECNSPNIRFSRSKTLSEKILSMAGFCPARCRDCRARFRLAVLWSADFVAHCPRCFSDRLVDWSEPYHYPPRWQRLLLKVGAKGHRCSLCRVNFISFLPRRSRITEPAWKNREIA